MTTKLEKIFTDVDTLITWEKIPNALHVDRHVTTVMEKTISRKCAAKGSKKQNVNSVVVDQKEFTFIVKEDEVSERLTSCVGGVNLKMLVDSGATSNVMGENVWDRLKAQQIKCYSYVPKEQRKLYPYSS